MPDGMKLELEVGADISDLKAQLMDFLSELSERRALDFDIAPALAKFSQLLASADKLSEKLENALGGPGGARSNRDVLMGAYETKVNRYVDEVIAKTLRNKEAMGQFKGQFAQELGKTTEQLTKKEITDLKDWVRNELARRMQTAFTPGGNYYGRQKSQKAEDSLKDIFAPVNADGKWRLPYGAGGASQVAEIDKLRKALSEADQEVKDLNFHFIDLGRAVTGAMGRASSAAKELDRTMEGATKRTTSQTIGQVRELKGAMQEFTTMVNVAQKDAARGMTVDIEGLKAYRNEILRLRDSLTTARSGNRITVDGKTRNLNPRQAETYDAAIQKAALIDRMGNTTFGGIQSLMEQKSLEAANRQRSVKTWAQVQSLNNTMGDAGHNFRYGTAADVPISKIVRELEMMKATVARKTTDYNKAFNAGDFKTAQALQQDLNVAHSAYKVQQEGFESMMRRAQRVGSYGEDYAPGRVNSYAKDLATRTGTLRDSSAVVRAEHARSLLSGSDSLEDLIGQRNALGTSINRAKTYLKSGDASETEAEEVRKDLEASKRYYREMETEIANHYKREGELAQRQNQTVRKEARLATYQQDGALAHANGITGDYARDLAVRMGVLRDNGISTTAAHVGGRLVGDATLEDMNAQRDQLRLSINRARRAMPGLEEGDQVELAKQLDAAKKYYALLEVELERHLAKEEAIIKGNQVASERASTKAASDRVKRTKASREQADLDMVGGLNADAIGGMDWLQLKSARQAVGTARRAYTRGVAGVPGKDELNEIEAALKAREGQVGQPGWGQKLVHALTGWLPPGGNGPGGTGTGGSAHGRGNDGLFNWLNHRTTNVAQMMGVSLYGMGTIGAATAAITGSVGAYSEKQQQVNTLGGLMNEYAQFVVKTNDATYAQANFTKALNYAGDVYGMVRKKAYDSVLTTQELFHVFMTGAPQLMAHGVNAERSLKMTNVVSSVGKSMGLEDVTIQGNLRALASGNLTTRSTILRAMGFDANKLREAMHEGPDQLNTYFDKVTSGFQPALDRMKDLAKNPITRFQDILQQTSISVGEGVAPGLIKGLQGAQPYIENFISSGQAEKFGESLGKLALVVIEDGTKIVAFLTPFLTNLNGLLIDGFLILLGKFAIGIILETEAAQKAMAAAFSSGGIGLAALGVGVIVAIFAAWGKAVEDRKDRLNEDMQDLQDKAVKGNKFNTEDQKTVDVNTARRMVANMGKGMSFSEMSSKAISGNEAQYGQIAAYRKAHENDTQVAGGDTDHGWFLNSAAQVENWMGGWGDSLRSGLKDSEAWAKEKNGELTSSVNNTALMDQLRAEAIRSTLGTKGFENLSDVKVNANFDSKYAGNKGVQENVSRTLFTLLQSFIKDPNAPLSFKGTLDTTEEKAARELANVMKVNSAVTQGLVTQIEHAIKLTPDTTTVNGTNLKATLLGRSVGLQGSEVMSQFQSQQAEIRAKYDAGEIKEESDAVAQLVEAQTKARNQMDALENAYQDQLRALRESIQTQQDELTTRREGIALMREQNALADRQRAVERMPKDTEAQRSTYTDAVIKLGMQQRGVDMGALQNTNSGLNRQAATVERAGDSIETVMGFFKGLKATGFPDVKMDPKSMEFISNNGSTFMKGMAGVSESIRGAEGANSEATKDNTTALKDNTSALRAGKGDGTMAATGSAAYDLNSLRSKLNVTSGPGAQKIMSAINAGKLPAAADVKAQIAYLQSHLATAPDGVPVAPNPLEDVLKPKPLFIPPTAPTIKPYSLMDALKPPTMPPVPAVPFGMTKTQIREKIAQLQSLGGLVKASSGSSPEFMAGLKKTAESMGVDSGGLLRIMQRESNMKPGWDSANGVVGLIQWDKAAAKGMGVTQNQLAGMSALEQLPYVQKYFKQKGLKPGTSITDMYALMRDSNYYGKPWNYSFEQADGSGDSGKFYRANKGQDINKDGRITKADLYGWLMGLSAREVTALENQGSLTGAGGSAKSMGFNLDGVKFRAAGDKSKMHPGLLQDLAAASQKFGEIYVSTAVDGHAYKTTSGNVSRHNFGEAVDITSIGGFNLHTPKGQALAKQLQAWYVNLGAGMNKENGNQAAALFGFNDPAKGGDHRFHVHMSNRGSALTGAMGTMSADGSGYVNGLKLEDIHQQRIEGMESTQEKLRANSDEIYQKTLTNVKDDADRYAQYIGARGQLMLEQLQAKPEDKVYTQIKIQIERERLDWQSGRGKYANGGMPLAQAQVDDSLMRSAINRKRGVETTSAYSALSKYMSGNSLTADEANSLSSYMGLNLSSSDLVSMGTLDMSRAGTYSHLSTSGQKILSSLLPGLKSAMPNGPTGRNRYTEMGKGYAGKAKEGQESIETQKEAFDREAIELEKAREKMQLMYAKPLQAFNMQLTGDNQTMMKYALAPISDRISGATKFDVAGSQADLSANIMSMYSDDRFQKATGKAFDQMTGDWETLTGKGKGQYGLDDDTASMMMQYMPGLGMLDKAKTQKTTDERDITAKKIEAAQDQEFANKTRENQQLLAEAALKASNQLNKLGETDWSRMLAAANGPQFDRFLYPSATFAEKMNKSRDDMTYNIGAQLDTKQSDMFNDAMQESDPNKRMQKLLEMDQWVKFQRPIEQSTMERNGLANLSKQGAAQALMIQHGQAGEALMKTGLGFANAVPTSIYSWFSDPKKLGQQLPGLMAPLTELQGNNLSRSANLGMMSMQGASFFTPEKLQEMSKDPYLSQFMRSVPGPGGMGPNQLKFSKGAALTNSLEWMGAGVVSDVGGNLLGHALFANKDPQAISEGNQLGSALGSALGPSLFAGLGAAAGPVGMIAGGLLGSLVGGLFGGSKPDPNAQKRQQLMEQHQQKVEQLLGDIGKKLDPQADYFNQLKNSALYGPSGLWYSGKAYATLGLQVAVGGR